MKKLIFLLLSALSLSAATPGRQVVTNLSSITTIATNDYLLLYRTSEGNIVQMKIQDLLDQYNSIPVPQYSTVIPLQSRLIIDGDSNTQGTNMNAGYPWPYYLTNNYITGFGFVSNRALNGRKWSDVNEDYYNTNIGIFTNISRITATTDYIDPTNCYVAYFLGTCDLFSTSSPTNYDVELAELTGFVLAYASNTIYLSSNIMSFSKRDGFKVIASTIPIMEYTTDWTKLNVDHYNRWMIETNKAWDFLIYRDLIVSTNDLELNGTDTFKVHYNATAQEKIAKAVYWALKQNIVKH
jgi:hypothetical protein